LAEPKGEVSRRAALNLYILFIKSAGWGMKKLSAALKRLGSVFIYPTLYFYELSRLLFRHVHTTLDPNAEKG